jgi:hypothetical protein
MIGSTADLCTWRHVENSWFENTNFAAQVRFTLPPGEQLFFTTVH